MRYLHYNIGRLALFILLVFTLLIMLFSFPSWLAGQGANANQKPALLFIVDGQSNAGSTGNGELLGPEWRGVDSEILFYSPQYLNHKNWVPLEPHPFQKRDFGIDSLGFGVELSFARTVKESFPDYVIAVARRSSGGTSIIAWDKDWQRPGWKNDMRRVENEDKPPQYPRLLKLVEEATAALLAEPGISRVEYGGFIWIQGERDSRFQFGAERYEDNLTALIANVRQDLNAPNLPFMFGEAHTHADAYMDVVDQAVRNVNQAVAHTGLVLTKDLSTYEGVHYDTEGTLELGLRFAAAFLELYIAENPSWTPAPTRTATPTPLRTATPSPSGTPSPTHTPRSTSTPTPTADIPSPVNPTAAVTPAPSVTGTVPPKPAYGSYIPLVAAASASR